MYGSPAWAALIAQIRRDPTNDQLRDVAADYLLEHDDPRGEFIVLRNRLAAGVPPSEYVAVYDRYHELAQLQPWRRRLELLLGTLPPAPTGFVDRAYVDRAHFERLPEICRHEPITQLAVDRLGTLTGDLLAMPELADMVELSVDERSRSLFASRQLGGVRVLRRVTHHEPDPYFRALAESVLRPHRIELDQNVLHYIPMLARGGILDELRVLPQALDDCVFALRDHPLAKLAELDTTKLSHTGVEQLAGKLDQLAILRVGDNADVILPIVIANVHSGCLRELALKIRDVDIPNVIALVDSAACLSLEKLTIRGLPLPLPIEQTIRKLAFHGHLREVVVEHRRGDRIQIPNTNVIVAW